MLISLIGWQTAKGQTDDTVYHPTVLNIADGPITIAGTDVNNYIITGTTTNNNNRIIIRSGYKGTIRFRNLNMTHSHTATSETSLWSAVLLEGENNRSNRDPVTKVKIVLEGTNNIFYQHSSNTTGNYGNCCIEVMQGAQVHFRAVDANDNTSGILNAYIRRSNNTSLGANTGGAAIGARIYNSGYSYNANTGGVHDNLTAGEGTALIPGASGNGLRNTAGGNIIISSGTIDAYGGHGAGIGGGFQTFHDGFIVIYGGNIRSRAWRHSAGIGSGCPYGRGVDTRQRAPNSSIIVLPPANIEGYGANTDGTVIDSLALAGAATIIYVNDPAKPKLVIHTEDDEPNADIYADLTETPELVDIFTTLGLDAEYDLAAAKFGRTSATTGKFEINAQLDQPITFFTDASSSGLQDPTMQGRPYLPVTRTIPAGNNTVTHDIELPFLPIDIFMEIFEATSKPLVVGYTGAEAEANAYHLKIRYLDTDPMTNVIYELEDGTNFGPLIFLDSDSSTVLLPSDLSTLTNGRTFYIIIPLKTGLPISNYRDVLAISGIWQGANTGKIRKVPEQRVVLDDTDDNKYIKVTANPPQGAIADPATYSVDLTLNIDHTGLPFSYDPLDVQARYLITTEPNYNAAVALTPVNQWPYLNTAAANATNAVTTVSFADKTSGTYYIHWFVVSGLVYAHSKDVIGPPPAQYGGFGPYSIVGVADDLATVYEYGSVSLHIFNNDVLTTSALNSIGSALDVVTQMPVAGELASGGHMLVYKHTGAVPLTHHIDSFAYRVTISGQNLEAKAYIYVLQSEDGNLAACKGTDYSLTLAGTNVAYSWYGAANNLLHTGATFTEHNIQSDLTLRVAPMRTAAPYRHLAFPAAPITIKVIDGQATMRWTGALDTNWQNPENWVDATSGKDAPVSWTPTGCIDVILPSNAPNYPELTRAAACGHIELKDRAMIAGIHHLTYDGASVEIILNASEKSRFVMWSAPLKSMYSGDFHYDYGSGPHWGDVSMNLFQHDHPAGGTAVANHFTATFGELAEPLSLGKAFNLHVTSTSANNGQAFYFPKEYTTYTDNLGTTHSVPRSEGGRFIVDNTQPLAPDGTFDMPVTSDMHGHHLIQVVNPYMAYLDMSEFLAGNPALTNNHAIWDGHITSSFNCIGQVGDSETHRYQITTIPSNSEKHDYISPLQSFFVHKASSDAINTVKMSPLWTTTKPESPYVLRAGTETEKNILRVKASQGESTSYAILHNDPSASSVYDSEQNMANLFYDAIPLEVYLISPSGQPLSIYSIGDFSGEVKLGVKTGRKGNVTLDFQSVTGFGHDVYLTDNSLKGDARNIDLQKSSTYIFSLQDNTGEINDRFSLRFAQKPTGIEGAEANGLKITQQNDLLHITSAAGPIASLQIYDVKGALLHTSAPQAEHCQVRLPAQQGYVVKAMVNGTLSTQKVIMK